LNHPKVDTELLQQILAQQLKTNLLLRELITKSQQAVNIMPPMIKLPPSRWETTCGTAMAT
jgi:hypothetical protein